MSVVSLETSETRQRLSAEDLAALPNERDFELVHGELVERSMGTESAFIAGRLFHLIFVYVELKCLGWAFSDGTGYVFPIKGEDTVRKPDVSYVSFRRLTPTEGLPKGYLKLAPDLAVEVVSPNDLAEEVDQKINDYLEAGVQLVWVVHPTSRTVTVHRSDNTTARVREAEYLDGENVLPGFQCKVADLFIVPQPAA
jgi:Uma2 family endonuclease